MLVKMIIIKLSDSSTASSILFSPVSSTCTSAAASSAPPTIHSVVYVAPKLAQQSDSTVHSRYLDILQRQVSHNGLSFGSNRLKSVCRAALANRDNLAEVAKLIHEQCNGENEEYYETLRVRAQSLPKTLRQKDSGCINWLIWSFLCTVFTKTSMQQLVRP